MASIQDFYLSHIGRGYDIDGAYGCQCWDGYAEYMRYLGYGYASCTSSGYVKDIWNNRASNGMLNSCVEVAPNQMQDGDIAIWTNCAACPYSHIAVFRKDNGNGTGVFLGQNQAGKMYFWQDNISYNGLLGAFRPKCYIKEAPKPITKIEYQAHVQDIGWMPAVADGQTAGTTGRGLRMEALKFCKLPTPLEIKVHVQDKGTLDYGVVTGDGVIGTVGEGKRLEAIYIKGNVKCQVHVSDSGWQAETDCSDGMWLGSKGMSETVEAIRFWVE